MLQLYSPYSDEQCERNLLDAIRRGAISNGHYVEEASHQLAHLIDAEGLVLLSDMSAAIEIALRLADICPGDEVLATSFACLSSNMPLKAAGAKVVWVDVNPKTGLMDTADLQRKISPKSRFCFVYHLAGYPADIEEIRKICKINRILVIEDCSTALLALDKSGSKVGKSDFSIYSFYPNRHLNGLEGAALVMHSPDFKSRAERLRRFGIDPGSFRLPNSEINPLSDVLEVARSSSFSNANAAFLLPQINSVEGRVKKARENVERIRSELLKLNCDRFGIVESYGVPSYWVMLLLSDYADQIRQNLRDFGVSSNGLHRPNHLYSVFADSYCELIGTDEFARRLIVLPCGWWLNESAVTSIIDAMRRALENIKC